MISIVVSREQEDEDYEKLYEVGWGGGKTNIFGWKKLSFDSSNCEVVEFVWILHNE
jgi:hypothetical protein